MRDLALSVCPEFVRSRWIRIEASPVGRRLVRGILWLLVGATLARVSWLIASVCVARLLGRVNFGQLGMIQTTMGMFGVLAGFELGMTATKYVAEYRTKDPAKAGRIMALSGLVVLVSAAAASLAVLCVAPWLAQRTLAAPHLTRFLRIGAAMMFFNALNGSQLGALAGLEKFQTLARLNVVVTVVAACIQVGAVYCGGLEGAVWGLVAASAVNWTVSHWVLRKEARRAAVPLAYGDCLREWPVLWKFSLPTTISSMLLIPVNWICSVMIVNQPQGYAELGIFSAANQWRVAILFIPSTISTVVLPMLSYLHGQNDQPQYNKVLGYNLLLVGAVASAVAAPLILLSPWIMAAYGPAFREGYVVLILLALVAVVHAVVNIVIRSIASEGKMWLGLMLNLIWAAVVLTMAWQGRREGALGLAVANLIAYGVYLVSSVAYLVSRNRTEKTT